MNSRLTLAVGLVLLAIGAVMLAFPMQVKLFIGSVTSGVGGGTPPKVLMLVAYVDGKSQKLSFSKISPPSTPDIIDIGSGEPILKSLLIDVSDADTYVKYCKVTVYYEDTGEVIWSGEAYNGGSEPWVVIQSINTKIQPNRNIIVKVYLKDADVPYSRSSTIYAKFKVLTQTAPVPPSPSIDAVIKANGIVISGKNEPVVVKPDKYGYITFELVVSKGAEYISSATLKIRDTKYGLTRGYNMDKVSSNVWRKKVYFYYEGTFEVWVEVKLTNGETKTIQVGAFNIPAGPPPEIVGLGWLLVLAAAGLLAVSAIDMVRGLRF